MALGPSEECDVGHFKDKESYQRGQVAFPRPHSQIGGTGTGALPCGGDRGPGQPMRLLTQPQGGSIVDGAQPVLVTSHPSPHQPLQILPHIDQVYIDTG